MKNIFTMLYSPAGGTMHLCASAVHRDKEESLWQCDHKIVTNQLQQEQFLQIVTTKILFSECYFQTKRICSRFMIPAPNFIEFYNGSDPVCDVFEHKLSSAFEHLSGEPKLELIVTVLNINEGHNALLMEHCKTLREYAQYVAKVRKYTADLSLNEAVERAVDECIKENILADFLRKNRAEVISMSIFEYDKEEEEKKLRKAEYEAGEKSGIQKGVLNTARHLLELNLLSLENISRATGLSIDELKKLQQ